MRTLASIAVLLALLAFGVFRLVSPADAPRTLYVGGPVLTMDAQDRVVEALGVEAGRIAAVGSEAELRAWADSSTRVVDLAGRTLMPGFIDAHGHFPAAGIYAVFADLNSAPVGQVASIDDLVERLRQKAAETSPGDWVVGMGYDDTLLAEGRHPTRQDLDRASTQHRIVAWHVSLHFATVNSAGLERLGIDAATKDPAGGVIRRGADGEPNGVLEEDASMIVADSIEPALRDAWGMAREASRLYTSQGVTTAQNGLATASQMRGLQWLSRLNIVPLRMVFWPDHDAAEQMLDGTYAFASYDNQWVRAGAVKLIADGSIQAYTGYLTKPYHIPPGQDLNYRGYPRIERDELHRLVDRFHRAGLQIAVHGNGDASIDDILDAFEAAQASHPREDARHVLVHAQMARDDQLDRMKMLGVIPSFFVLHTYYWGERHREIFMGPERAARMSPTRGAVDRDLRFTIHADTPVVPMEPLRLVWSAVNRVSSEGEVIGAEQRISARQALRAVTIDAAYQHFQEDDRGSLEVGKLADLVILSDNPLDRPETIDRIRVVETIIGGRTVYP